MTRTGKPSILKSCSLILRCSVSKEPAVPTADSSRRLIYTAFRLLQADAGDFLVASFVTRRAAVLFELGTIGATGV